jgi:multiple sugar transport system substrate-binding protein
MVRSIIHSMCLGLLLSLSMAACTPTASPAVRQTPPGQKPVPTLVATRPESLATPSVYPTATSSADGRVKIRWFIGVGTGKTFDEMNTAREFVKQFNDSQTKIQLELEAVTTNTHEAIDKLMKDIQSGDPPDIVAPADKGWAGEQLTGYILTVDPVQVKRTLPEVDAKVLDSWQESGGTIGIPAGVFPSAIFYNKKLFDAAGLPYPPHKFGEPYADGEAWTIDKMEKIALQLTIDFNGKNASQPGFDPGAITQWGFHWQWDSTRSMAVLFGPGSVVDDQGNAVIPPQWRDAFHWYYAGMWQKHFIPTLTQTNNLERGNPFISGKVAMVNSFLWYSPRLVNFANWDLAAVPSYQSKITTRMERDGVIILNTTQHPQEAMQVAYVIATSRELLLAWEMLPTTKSLQPQFLADLQVRHPGVDWQVILDCLDYADTTYENTMPNYRKSYDRLLEFKDLIASKGNLSLDEDLDRLQADLQALFEADR